MNAYEWKQEARRQRLEARAARLANESDAAFKRASDMASVIPMGQPILIGHHSEGRDRRYRAKIARTMDKACELSAAAKHVAARAMLKQWGFRWSPTNAAWQRLLNNAGRHAAQYVTNKLAGIL